MVIKLSILLVVLEICCINATLSDGPHFPPPFRPWRTHPPGHLKTFGHQRPPNGPVRPYVDRFLHPVDFWEYHVKNKLPLVYRNAVSRSPAIKLWDDEYLLKNYGNLDVLVERKVENRSYTPRRMVLKGFLKQYKKEDIYVVTVLPDAMRHEVQIVPSVLCGTFKTYLQETNLWIGSGGTSSIVHFDADHNIHCLMHGRKDFMMIHHRYYKYLYFKQNERGSGSGYSNINVNKIDMKKYPLLKRVPWTYATLRAGDCIYIPGGYIHQVRSYDRTISVTTLFSPTKTFNSSGCENLNMNYTPMSDAPIHWTYKEGDQTIDLGYNNLIIVRTDLLKLFAKLKVKKVTKKFFVQQLGRELSDNWQMPVQEVYDKYFDPNGKGYFTKKDIEELPTEALKGIARSMENPAGPLKAAEKIDWEQLLRDRLAQEEEAAKTMQGDEGDNDDNEDDEHEDEDDENYAEDQDQIKQKQHQHQEL